ncbi:hypothetical protein FN846DRAFT_902160 [Sphaerosporella brunnea]|uniref:Rhodopsin domain-containing protein n=1 Tax=Sphaerosporella brunnea TaxID=1250544 RepID=A0A5J5FB86_9PEZI|nr:hypothetical protein FN846DRAFT_902160 [Sphaerosporella brunnea]
MSVNGTSISAGIPPPGISSNFTNPDSIGYKLLCCNITAIIGTTVFLGLRLYTRLCIVRQPGLDDLFIVLAWLFCLAMGSVSSVEVTHYGLGRHVWDVELALYSPYFLKLDALSSMFYFLSNMFIKCAVIYLFIRLSKAHARYVQWYLCSLMGFSIFYNIYAILRLIFLCKPVAALWDIKLMADATCANRPQIYIIISCVNVATDVLVVLAPLGLFGTMNLPFRQKVAMLGLLMIGGVACIFGIIRMANLFKGLPNGDDTRGLVQIICWSIAEIGFGCICACAACLKPFFLRYSTWLTTTPTHTKCVDTRSRNRKHGQVAAAAASASSPGSYILGSLTTQHREQSLKLRPQDGPNGVNTSAVTSGSARKYQRNKAPNDSSHNGSQGDLVVDPDPRCIMVSNDFEVVEEIADG